MPFNEQNLSDGEAAFVSTWTYYSETDPLEEMLAPAYFPRGRFEWRVRDTVRFVDRDMRACHALVASLTELGDPVFVVFEATARVPVPAILPATGTTHPAGGQQRRAAA